MRIEIVVAIFLLLVVLLVYRMFADLCLRKDEKQTSERASALPPEDEVRILEEAQLPGSKR
jgi:hypothetical protein